MAHAHNNTLQSDACRFRTSNVIGSKHDTSCEHHAHVYVKGKELKGSTLHAIYKT